jgi:hypothetical protein
VSDVIVTDGDKQLALGILLVVAADPKMSALDVAPMAAAYRVKVAAEERARCVEFLRGEAKHQQRLSDAIAAEDKLDSDGSTAFACSHAAGVLQETADQLGGK